MTTKICNFAKKIILFSFFMRYLFSTCGFCEDKKWTLAAQPFSYVQKNTPSASDIAITKSIPSLILEQVAQNITRMPRAREILDRKLFDLKKERLSLFLQLSKEVQTRDSLALGNYSQRQLKRKIREADKKINDIQKKIDENLKQVKEEEQKRRKQILQDEERDKSLAAGEIIDDSKNGENAFIRFFSDITNNQDEIVLEQVVLYQNDFSKLFEPSESVRTQDYSSYAFQKACSDANIQGLLTGSISMYGSYISISTNLYVYPDGRLIASATDVGLFDEMRTLATNIASQLTPRIADSMPVELLFEIFPEEAREKIFVTVDDVVYPHAESVLIPSGIHTVSFSAEGYVSEATSYSFFGNRQFKISVNLEEDKHGEINLAFKKAYTGDVFANGLFNDSINAEKRFAKISINNKQILGHFISEDGLPADFIIPAKLLQDGSFLIINTKPLDRSAYIEKRRLWMYRTYSLLIVSLIPTFYCNGTYTALATAYNEKYDISYDEASKWQDATNITTGISIGCGALFVIELVRYLVAANSVLPLKAKVAKTKNVTKIKKAEERALEKRLKEEERLAQEEVAKAAEEADKTTDDTNDGESNTEETTSDEKITGNEKTTDTTKK